MVPWPSHSLSQLLIFKAPSPLQLLRTHLLLPLPNPTEDVPAFSVRTALSDCVSPGQGRRAYLLSSNLGHPAINALSSCEPRT